MVMVDLDTEPELIGPMVEGVRIFAGYSGWTIGQLEGEIERDDWIVSSALPSDVSSSRRVDLWGRVLRRQPLPLSLLATTRSSQPELVPRQRARRAGAGATASPDAVPQDGPAPAWATTNFALCQQPAATVAMAPSTHTTTTTAAVSGDDSATTPATAKIAAAASCVGATSAQNLSDDVSGAGTRQSPSAECGGGDGGTETSDRREEHAAHLKRRRAPRATGALLAQPRRRAVLSQRVRPGTPILNPLVIASVAFAVGTASPTVVVTESDTRYLSCPATAMVFLRAVLSDMLLSL